MGKGAGRRPSFLASIAVRCNFCGLFFAPSLENRKTMTRIRIKRVYETAAPEDGCRVLVDKLWPRGVARDNLHYDLWAKGLAPSAELRRWYHADPETRWAEFRHRYLQELRSSQAVREFVRETEGAGTVTLLYASKNAVRNHALILREYLQQASERVTAV